MANFYIPICVDNLAQFFAFGFLTPASVFPFNDYLPDELSLHSHAIPMHKKPSSKVKIPNKGIQASKQEDINLKSAVVVVAIDESKLEKSESSPWFFLTGILPINLIKEITFEDEDALDHFNYLTTRTGRVSSDLLNGITFKKGGFDKLFLDINSSDLSIDKDSATPGITTQALKVDSKALQKMSGYGAALAMAYVMAKNSDVANNGFKELSKLDEKSDGSLLAIKLFSSYLYRHLDEEPSKQRIQDEFFDVLVGCSNQEKVLDRLIPFFDLDIGDTKASEFLRALKVHVSDILKGKVDSTKSEQMEAFSTVERVSQFINQIVIMFTLLDESEKLFTQPITTITGEGYLNIAVAYGLRDKFYELPKDVRQIQGLEIFVIDRMYEYYLKITEQKVKKSKPKFGDVPTLIDIMSDSDTPKIKSALEQRFGLISEMIPQPTVVIAGESYVPENPEAMLKPLQTNSHEFSEKMIPQKAFEDVDFNVIIELYKEEKSLASARKKYAKRLMKL